MSDLKTRVANLAMSYPEGSPERSKLLHVIAASFETYHTQQGTEFKIRTTDFAKFLRRELGVPAGADLGAYLREEKQITDASLPSLSKRYNAKVKGPERKRDPFAIREKGPDIQRLWDNLVAAIYKDLRGYGSDAGDMFVNMPKEYEDDYFEQYLQGVAGDVGMEFEYALGDRARNWWDKFVLALKTGIYKGGGYDNWTLRHRKSILKDIYADAWYDAMSKGWDKVKRNPREFERLKALRASFTR